MKKFYNLMICVLLLIMICTTAEAFAKEKIKVVASTLDMADFAKNIGGQYVDVYAISTGKVDLHFFEPRPSHVLKLKNADLLIIGGMDLDIWIRSLIDASRNPKIRFGAPGYVDPSDGIVPLDVPPGRIDPSMGDVHPYGNPHFWFNPDNVRTAVENICKGLIRIDPDHKAYYLEQKDKYLGEVQTTYKKLMEKMKPYKGTKVVQFHKSWDYFCNCFGLEVIGELEPKPGIPPTAGHLKELVKKIHDSGAKIMLVEPYYPGKPVEFVAANSGIKILRLPNYLGSKEGIDSYLENLQYNVDSIVKALSEQK